MALEIFKPYRIQEATKALLNDMIEIIEDYSEQGYTLSLRQLYYQLVARDIIPNKDSEYKKISSILNKARLGGLVDWEAIEDRTRVIQTVATWDSPRSILTTAARQFKIDILQNQSTHVEVWVEKDALSEVVKRAAHRYQIPVLVNRGYASVSAIYQSYQRLYDAYYIDNKRDIKILYLGDHDPSGLDMIRDIEERLSMMLYSNSERYEFDFSVKHIALTQGQIKEYSPPPNPAKLKDPRSEWYTSIFGYVSWEVDALPPPVLNEIITSNIQSLLDMELVKKYEEEQEKQRELINEFIKTL